MVNAFGRLRVVAVMAVGLHVSACSVVRIVPIQMARISQQEVYEQRFVFAEPTGPDEEARQRDRIREISTVFRSFLGDDNWQTLTRMYGNVDFLDDVQNGDIFIRGKMALIIYLDPLNQSQFLLEGQGRYFVLRRETNEILLSGDFHLDPQHFLQDQLAAGRLDLKVRLFTARIPNAQTYYHESQVTYRVYFDTLLKEEGIYSLDYDRCHEALIDGKKFGELRFTTVHPTDKLLDLRGQRYLRRDYRKKRIKHLLEADDNEKTDGRGMSP